MIGSRALDFEVRVGFRARGLGKQKFGDKEIWLVVDAIGAMTL